LKQKITKSQRITKSKRILNSVLFKIGSNRIANNESVAVLTESKTAMVGLSIIVGVLIIALLSPIISPYDPLEVSMSIRLQSPSLSHILGTDVLGRDILSRILWGSRVSLLVGAISVSIGLFIGVPLGLISGYYLGKIDYVISRVTDILLSFPSIVLALAIAAGLGVSIIKAMTAVGIVMAPRYTRLTRGVVISIRENEYIQAAKAVGARDSTIIIKHILPNSLAPLVVQATISLAFAIIIEASLSFLGLGVQPPTPSWGSMISDGRAYLRTAPWISTFSGLSIMITVLGFNLFGDGLRDALDPRMRGLVGGESNE
jgi:peptide/nickel transport system permease protein